MFASPTTWNTARLTLRRPTPEDAQAIFTAYASDPEATRYMSWLVHRSIEDTRGFISFANQEWNECGVGAYLIQLDSAVIGSTGLHLAAPHRAVIGYILSRQLWGHGYATEACTAMVELGRSLRLERVEAQCHADHVESARVLEKSGMIFEGVLRKHSLFPNLSPLPQDVRSYAWTS
ncbi:MAG: hypothetical protein AUG04_09165 [Deltaproteobacteria bacterium 13_1_20CM_2_69_21]|nr:MAG: hypothetical protein AUG04_09165 [Deltaproteobacteria bacterium 13_1_20CM_2_69_21]